MTVKLTDGSDFDLEDICWIERRGLGVAVYCEVDDDEYEEILFDQENSERILVVVREHSISSDDVEALCFIQ